jgi:hypothetical protein
MFPAKSLPALTVVACLQLVTFILYANNFPLHQEFLARLKRAQERDPVVDEELRAFLRPFPQVRPSEHPWERSPAMANSSISSLDLPVRGASPASSISGAYGGANGASNGANYASPLPAGHQQDLNYLYEQIQELSGLLKANRARTAELTKRAEQAEVGLQIYERVYRLTLRS